MTKYVMKVLPEIPPKKHNSEIRGCVLSKIFRKITIIYLLGGDLVQFEKIICRVNMLKEKNKYFAIFIL